jgi:hypothetical protein
VLALVHFLAKSAVVCQVMGKGEDTQQKRPASVSACEEKTSVRWAVMLPNHILTQAPGLLRPWRFRHRKQFIVHVDRIDALVEKAQEMGDGHARRQRFLVAPDDVLEDHFANSD